MRTLAIGLAYDLLGSYPGGPGAPADADAEFEPEATVEALEAAISRLGHRPVRLGNPHALLAKAGKGEVPTLDAAMTIAEGFGTRNREAWVPVLLEMLAVPTIGSDALTLSLSLDKAWTKDVVAAAGVPVAPHLSVRSRSELAGRALPGAFPLFVKPRWEGTAKGIAASSRVEDPEALAREVERVVRAYRQPVLIEPFLSGAEYTVTLIGNSPPTATARPSTRSRTRHGHRSARARTPRHRGEPNASSPPAGGAESRPRSNASRELAQRAFDALECRDFARADFRLNAEGEPRFLEMNPLPTFSPDGSFGILAELLGRPLPDLLAEVIKGGLIRLGLAA